MENLSSKRMISPPPHTHHVILWLVLVFITVVAVAAVAYAYIFQPTAEEMDIAESGIVCGDGICTATEQECIPTLCGDGSPSCPQCTKYYCPADCAYPGFNDQNVNTSTTDAEEWLTYTNDEIGVSFEYPSSWQPVNESRIEESESDQGSRVRVDFSGSQGDSGFDTTFQLLYTTPDFSSGSEPWLGDLLASQYEQNGMSGICTPAADDELYLYLKDVHHCAIREWEGRATAEFFTQINGLDEAEISSFVKVFAFETGNETYPLAQLVMYLPEANPDNVPVADTEAVEDIYDGLRLGSLNAETNKQIADFSMIRESLTAIQ